MSLTLGLCEAMVLHQRARRLSRPPRDWPALGRRALYRGADRPRMRRRAVKAARRPTLRARWSKTVPRCGP